MDWKQLLVDLKGAGLAQQDIADYCKVAQSSVSDLARGKTTEPAFSFGQALVRLHKRTLGKRQKSDAPVAGDRRQQRGRRATDHARA